MSDPEYPKADYPKIISGKVHARTLRLESLDGSVMLATPKDLEMFNGVKWVDGKFVLKDFGPVFLNGKMWGVTHLQKQSRCGYLKADPDCYHRWYFWKRQTLDENGNGIPGTESGIYFRKSRTFFRLKCWRWDVAGTTIDGQLRHWILSGGYAGGHWD